MNQRLALPGVSLCAATSVNLCATISALERCIALVEFGDAILFTDQPVDDLPHGLRRIEIANLPEAANYSAFMLRELVQHIRTEHVLVAQWDGFILHPEAWQNSFLEFDFVGAIWPQFTDGANVGNGGFSLRSRRLLEACLAPDFEGGHPEDVAICRWNRSLLEEKHGIRFATEATARQFAFEREQACSPSFGFHGVFNMPAAVGRNQFWAVYRTLEDRRSVFHDVLPIARALGPKLGLSLLFDFLGSRLGAGLESIRRQR